MVGEFMHSCCVKQMKMTFVTGLSFYFLVCLTISQTYSKGQTGGDLNGSNIYNTQPYDTPYEYYPYEDNPSDNSYNYYYYYNEEPTTKADTGIIYSYQLTSSLPTEKAPTSTSDLSSTSSSQVRHKLLWIM